MSVAAVLGVMASAAQLVVYGTGILAFLADLYDRVRDVPAPYCEYELQLKLLVNISRAIEQNPALRIPGVQAYLDAILVEVRTLQSILCSPASGSAGTRKLWGLITGREQRKIFEHLGSLHRNNTGLLLCISTANTSQLSSMQDNMVKLITGREKRELGSRVDDSRMEYILKLLEAFRMSGLPQFENNENEAENETSRALIPNSGLVPAGRMPDRQSDPIKVDQQAACNLFESVIIRGPAEIHNGDTIQVPIQEGCGDDTVFCVNDFQKIHVTGGESSIARNGQSSIVHNGQIGGRSRMGNRFQLVDINTGGVLTVQNGNFDTVEAKEQFLRHARGRDRS
ncbi:hypothetical protein B7494_g350 [Chlorociboria aeruginascens]|nr:hypothetical protein B7494_g350 [Chlorociboria aeruginascens]